ncbi:type VI secretion system protein [Agarivorans sp. Z349TD_8]|uniref:type VI secretion system protein n=1 Tax=Agarivorans sp. Z349TD_8 TaxID=3421434 RepID=UPI003D7CDB6A
MAELFAKLNSLWGTSEVWLREVSGGVQQRLSPLVVMLDPYWNDPVWRVLFIFFLLLLIVILAWWLLKLGFTWISVLFSTINVGAKALLCWLAKPFSVARLWFDKYREAYRRKARQNLRLRIRMKRIRDTLKYLTTSRQWRYKSSWFLLLGEAGSGGNALLEGIRSGKRAALLHREKQQHAAGSQWHFFDNGVLIEADQELLVESQTGHNPSGEMPRLAKLLEVIHRYRPERPLDGIVMSISAKSLLMADNIYRQAELSEQLFKQLWLVQKKSSFVLPIYLVVTECDVIEGFEAFWQAQSDQRWREMIGWSNPLQLESSFDPNWIDLAFEQVVADLQLAQLEVAASSREIVDIDQFMLFHQHFRRMQSPLKKVMEGTFSRSQFQAPLPLRGVFFCGAVEQVPAFTDQLFNQKIFAELNLATPLERRLLSSEKLLQRFQLSTMGFGALLLLWLCFDSVRMLNYNHNFTRVLKQAASEISDSTTNCPSLGQNPYRLLAHLAEVGHKPWNLSMPVSWLDTQLYKNQLVVGNQLLSPQLFSSLECRLSVKAIELNKLEQQGSKSQANESALTEQLFVFVDSMSIFNTSVDDFVYLAGPLGSDKQVQARLTSLLDYAYDVPVPEASRPSSPLVTGAIQVMEYKVKQQTLTDPERNITHLLQSAKRLHQALIDSTHPRFLSELGKDDALTSNLLISQLRSLGEWLSTSNLKWTVPYSASPCGKVSTHLASAIKGLRKSGDHPAWILDEISELFGEQRCYQVAQQKLLAVNLAQHGSAFVSAGKLVRMSPKLVTLQQEIKALEQLPFVIQQLSGTLSPLPTTPIQRWRLGPLNQALESIRQYQAFEARYYHSADSFYANSIRHKLSDVITNQLNDAMQRQARLANSLENSDKEAELALSINNFVNVQDAILNLEQLLMQLGDTRNRIWLKQSARNHARQLLEQIDELVSLDRLYVAEKKPDWQQLNFAQALFAIETDKQLSQYAIAQRQRLSYLAQSYAQPLVGFLLNSGGIEQLGGSSQRWFDTLNTLAKYQRKDPDNDLSKLESLITTTLPEMTMLQCSDVDVSPQRGGSWFGEKLQRLDLQVWAHCKKSTQARAIDSYLAMARRFDQQLAGLFPFSEVSEAGKNDLPLSTAVGFFTSPDNDPQLLSEQLDAMAKAYPAKIPTSWKRFLKQLNQFKNWLNSGLASDGQTWSAELDVQFNALSGKAKGTNQIVRWELSSSQQLIGFPNQGEVIHWQVGRPLALELFWADSSPYQPYTLANLPHATFVSQRSAVRFETTGAWGLYEWLIRYADSMHMKPESMAAGTQLLMFNVPVSYKEKLPQQQKLAYVSQPNIALTGQYTDAKGLRHTMSWPQALPQKAPNFSDN